MNLVSVTHQDETKKDAEAVLVAMGMEIQVLGAFVNEDVGISLLSGSCKLQKKRNSADGQDFCTLAD